MMRQRCSFGCAEIPTDSVSCSAIQTGRWAIPPVGNPRSFINHSRDKGEDYRVIFRAKYLIPNSRLIIENGAIAIHGSEIVDIGRYPTLRNTGTGPIRDLGDAVILPGLVNSHTHLELTNHGVFVDRTAQLTN
jgi:hypothetical protein